MTDWVQRLGKWRTIFAGWQLGTRAKGDPEGDAVRDLRELCLLMRAELNAFGVLLIGAGVFDAKEFHDALQVEARLLCAELEKRFPGASATDDGMALDMQKAQAWLKDFPK